MTIKDRILEYLRAHPEGATDDEVVKALHLKHHAQANQRCNALASERLIVRRKVDGKYRNFAVQPTQHHLLSRLRSLKPSVPLPVSKMPLPKRNEEGTNSLHGIPTERPWFWEGNVQDTVVRHLQTRRYNILRVADTASREPGKDIIAANVDGQLWVTVKGFPQGTARTSPSTQAGHWFKDALFDVIAWKTDAEAQNARIALALPDFPRYRRLADRVTWLQPLVPFVTLWVRQDKTVISEPPL